MSIVLTRKSFKRKPGKRPANLTGRQWDVLRYMLLCWLGGGIPTVREIGDELGIRSPNGVACHLRALRKKGWVRETERTCLELTDAALDLTP